MLHLAQSLQNRFFLLLWQDSICSKIWKCKYILAKFVSFHDKTFFSRTFLEAFFCGSKWVLFHSSRGKSGFWNEKVADQWSRWLSLAIILALCNPNKYKRAHLFIYNNLGCRVPGFHVTADRFSFLYDSSLSWSGSNCDVPLLLTLYSQTNCPLSITLCAPLPILLLWSRPCSPLL